LAYARSRLCQNARRLRELRILDRNNEVARHRCRVPNRSTSGRATTCDDWSPNGRFPKFILPRAPRIIRIKHVSNASNNGGRLLRNVRLNYTIDNESIEGKACE
jgi:hypothetical protein